MLLIRPRLQHRAGGGGRRPTGYEALGRALLAYKRGEPRVCSIVRLPTPEDEDRRRLCRERKVLTMERVQHVNRIKGLLFSQGVSGYEPLRRDRRERLEALQTGTLAGHKTRAAETLKRLAQNQPRAFVHWSLGYLS